MRKFNMFLVMPLVFSSMLHANELKELCPNSFTNEQCELIVEKVKEVFEKENPKTVEQFKASAENIFNSLKNDSKFYQSFLNMPYVKNKLDSSPLALKFSMIDREDEDSVVGLEFSYTNAFNKKNLSNNGKRSTSFGIDFSVNGTITHKAEENPRNFLIAKLSARYSSDPFFSIDPAVKSSLPLFDKAREQYCLDDIDGAADSELCDAYDTGIYNELFSDPSGFSFIDAGLDIGFETDQRFDANNKTIGGFVYYSYENHNSESLLGAYKIKPAILLNIDSVTPSNETPRALAGDSSSYQRVSYELSLNAPLDDLMNIPYTFTFNFRGYEELSPSDIVKAANLDKYRLRTYSLITPIGIAVSYSSGRLPFGISDESIVALGYQTYF